MKLGFVMKKIVKFAGNVKHFLRKNLTDNISAIAGQTSFFIILSFVPFMMFTFALLSYFNIPAQMFESYYVDAFPENVSEYLKNIIYDAYPTAVELAFTSAIIALWSAGRGIYCITQGVFIIYKKPDRKNWFFKRLKATVYTLIMFIVLLLSLIVLVVSQFFSDLIVEYLSSLPYSLDVLYAFRYIIMFVLLVILIALALKLVLYTRIKEKKYAKLKCLLPGVIMTSLGWIVLSVLISLYVDFFDGFTLYGSLTTAVIVMVWLYFAMYIFLCGIQFNYIYRKKIYNFKFRNLFKRKK